MYRSKIDGGNRNLTSKQTTKRPRSLQTFGRYISAHSRRFEPLVRVRTASDGIAKKMTELPVLVQRLRSADPPLDRMEGNTEFPRRLQELEAMCRPLRDKAASQAAIEGLSRRTEVSLQATELPILAKLGITLDQYEQDKEKLKQILEDSNKQVVTAKQALDSKTDQLKQSEESLKLAREQSSTLQCSAKEALAYLEVSENSRTEG